MNQRRRREHAQPRFAKRFKQSAVFKLAHHPGKQVMALKPLVQARAHRGMANGQQHRQALQSGGWVQRPAVLPLGQPVPAQGRLAQRMAVNAQIRVVGRGAIGQHHVQPVQGQVGKQVFHLGFVAFQSQVGLFEHRPQQAGYGVFGQTI